MSWRFFLEIDISGKSGLTMLLMMKPTWKTNVTTRIMLMKLRVGFISEILSEVFVL